MSLSTSKTFRAIGYGFLGLVLLSFAARVLYMVTTGSGNATYTNAKGIVWNYSSALVVFIGIAIVFLVAGAHRVWTWFRDR